MNTKCIKMMKLSAVCTIYQNCYYLKTLFNYINSYYFVAADMSALYLYKHARFVLMEMLHREYRMIRLLVSKLCQWLDLNKTLLLLQFKSSIYLIMANVNKIVVKELLKY